MFGQLEIKKLLAVEFSPAFFYPVQLRPAFHQLSTVKHFNLPSRVGTKGNILYLYKKKSQNDSYVGFW